MKRVLIVFLVCCVLLSSFPSVALADQPSDEEIAAGLAVPSDSIIASRDSRSLSFEQYSSTRSLSLSDGTYYLNNKGCGKYLRYYSSALALTNGYVSTYGNSIKWKITSVSGGYTISSVSDSTKYLGVPTDTSSYSVELVTVSSGSSLPARCKWIFEVADGGGCLVKNVYNSKYMYTTGTYFYTADVAGTSGTTMYYSKTWRIITPENLSGKELNFASFDTLTLISGEILSPTISVRPSSSVWATSTDFIYTGYNTSYVTFNMGTGKFTASTSLNSLYSTTITATHRVTGATATFSLIIRPKAILLGVPDVGHNHISCLNSIRTIITGMGYSSASAYEGTFSNVTLDNYLDTDTNGIFVVRSHGGYETSPWSGEQVGTYILTSGNDYDGTILYRSHTMATTLELSNMELIMFIGCETGKGGVGARNLPTVVVDRGATTAVGFSETIGCSSANRWTIAFFDLLSEGKSVYEACLTLSDEYEGTGLDKYVICGYKYSVIK